MINIAKKVEFAEWLKRFEDIVTLVFSRGLASTTSGKL